MQPSPNTVRPAAVAGSFYPDDPSALRARLRGDLALAPVAEGPSPKALIAPHAGYIYSGPIAARAYASVARRRGHIRRVVLLGPAHRVSLRGIALPGVDRFATPLGEVEVDRSAVDALRSLPQVVESPGAHAMEHSLEVHLPFLQEVLGSFTLVPLVVGSASPGEVAEVLERLWGGDETLVVVSSDLSHHLPYARGRRQDEDTVRRVLALDARIGPDEACGAAPVNGLLELARRRGLHAELLDLRSSGDTAGDRAEVVGYASIAFYERPGVAPTDDGLGRALLAHARAAISEALGASAPAPVDHPSLRRPGATFVTLKIGDALRGCIGSLSPRRALREDVRENAVAAALEDDRFAPLRADELPRLVVEVSLLSPSSAIAFDGEADLRARLRPGVDGVTLSLGDRRATFLPQVWDDVPDPGDFLRHLKRKMGLPGDYWSPAMSAARYTVEKWSEREAR